MRTAARKDANHNEITRLFIACGWSVLDIYQLKNCCDCFVSKSGRTVAIEIKDSAKPPSAQKLTKGEAAFFKSWQGERAIVRCVDDALQIMRESTDWSKLK